MRIGPYEVVGTLGMGGAGAVYRARSPSGGEVAVKVLRALDQERLARFERERRLLAAFGVEDGFVPLLDSGATSAGPYLVMPVVTGGTLRDRLEAGRLGVTETLALGRKLARALGRAHAKGIVHRDMKPENCLFHEGEPLVADLGLGKHFDRDATGAGASLSLSNAGQMRGTFGYMPREQMVDAKAVGPEVDVFALGAILYECLAGKPAFAGESMVQLLQAVTVGAVEPLERVRPDAPPWLANVIERALAPSPAGRFANAAHLERALVGPKEERRRSPLPALLALVVVALVGLALLRGRGTSAPDAVAAVETRGGAPKGADQGAAATVSATVPADPKALYDRALHLEDRADAAKLLREAARLGYRPASVELGRRATRSAGVSQDEPDAATWIRVAAEEGDTWSMIALSALLETGHGTARNEAEAAEWNLKAGKAGNMNGFVRYGSNLRDGRGVAQDLVKAVAYFRDAAEKGDSWGMLNLGRCLERGEGGPADPTAAFAWYRKAVDQENVGAMVALGIMLREGNGVEKDENTAAALFERAAADGNEWGLYNLGLAYEKGEGVAPDMAKAVGLYRRAAEKGNDLARAALARLGK